jgi:alpha-beta hydrolase superfamily lysophospholipase
MRRTLKTAGAVRTVTGAQFPAFLEFLNPSKGDIMGSSRTLYDPSRHLAKWCLTAALVGALVACSQMPASHSTSVAEGPAGLSFYTPPSPLPAGHHGDLIWARTLTGDAAMPAAGHNWLVLYRSTDTAGQPIAVSGTVAVPAGTPPKGGWPVISWTHGTTGIADVCAPSRNGPDYPDKSYVDGINLVLNQWVQKGYAVLKTDYQGLGTPGVHPYLDGRSEARSATDIVLAARELDPALSRDWVVMGHSQGGQAAIYTTEIGTAYGHGLDLKGAVGISPASYLAEQVALGLKQTTAQANAFFPLIMVGMSASAPGVQVDKLLTPKGRELIGVVNQGCQGAFSKPGAWSSYKNDQVMNVKADFKPLEAALTSLSATQNVRPTVPLLVLQAKNDQIVYSQFTNLMVQRFKDLGVDLHYVEYTDIPNFPAVNVHRATVNRSLPDAVTWVEQHLPPGQ